MVLIMQNIIQDRFYIYRNYNKKCLDDKHENKIMLQRELGLPQREDIPMIGLVSRLTHQKGCDLI